MTMLFSRGLVACMLMANVHVCGSMLTKPSPAKLIVLREKWLIQRGQANYARALAVQNKELSEFPGEAPSFSQSLFNNGKARKEAELQKLEDELKSSLKKSGCFSVETFSILIKLNAKSNEKVSMIDYLTNAQALQAFVLAGLIQSAICSRL